MVTCITKGQAKGQWHNSGVYQIATISNKQHHLMLDARRPNLDSPVGISTCSIVTDLLIVIGPEAVPIEVASEEVAPAAVLEHAQRLVDAAEDLVGHLARWPAQALDQLGHVVGRPLRGQPPHQIQ